ncbi:hypothetical protein HDU96_002255 [Phlyctochytrium bullatum]|nr:hypothetical protein HDU96_002255 [Phlyctochytrium bullatum]
MAVPIARAQTTFGGAGYSIYFRQALDFPTELSYRTQMVMNVFSEDTGLFPIMIAQFDGATQNRFGNITDVTLEAWVKPVPIAQQNNPQKGCCWPVFGTHDLDDAARPHVSMAFADGQSLAFATTHRNASDVCAQTYNQRSPTASYASWYLDGELIFSMRCSSQLTMAGASVYVGTTVEQSPKSYWEGEIDEVRLWPTARTQSQIRSGMTRVLTTAETAATVLYYNFDNYNVSNPYILPDLGPSGFNLNLGKNNEMKFAQDRLTPKFLGSTAPVKNSNIVLDVYRATNKFNGTYSINSLIDTASASVAGATVTLTTLIPSEYGVAIRTGASLTIVTTQPFVMPATQTLTIFAQENADYSLRDGLVSFPVTVTSGSTTTAFNITLNIRTPKPIHPGSGGSALYCDGRRHALAKDFSFGPTATSPKFTIEFWAYQFYILPVLFPASVFSIGNGEISAPGEFNWCFQQPTPKVPASSFCRGRLLLDLPNPLGYADVYSGWNPDANTGLTGAIVNNRYGTWYHVAMTADGINVTLYLNGEIAARTTDYGIVPNPTNTPLGLFMCAWPFWDANAPEHNYKGFMDEFRIWNVSRTQQQIRSTMHAAIPDPAAYPDLITYYNFDELVAQQDVNVTSTVKVAKDLGRLKNDLVFGECMPNRAPYCKSTTGVCDKKDLPRVPCYTDLATGEARSELMPLEFPSAAPISGYSPSYLARGGSNITIRLSSSFDGTGGNPLVGTTFIITKAPSAENGVLYSSDGVTPLQVGSRVRDSRLLFIPTAGRGGDPLDTLSFTTESVYFSSNRTATIRISVLCPVGTVLSGSGNCQSCPAGTYNLKESFATSCQAYMNLSFSNASGILLTVVNAACALVTLLISLGVVLFRKEKVITAASPLFCYLILLGCLMGHVVVFTFPLLPTQNICYTQPVLEVLAYTLVMTNIGIKTFRIHRIFNTLKVAKSDIMIKDYFLFAVAMGFLAIDAIILASWLAKDPTLVIEMANSNGDLFLACSSGSQSAQTRYNSVIVVYKVAMTLATLYLGMKVRYITSSSFNESKYIVLCIYTISVISIILIPLIYLGDSISFMVRQLFAGVIAAFLCTSTAAILFGPKLLVIYKGKSNAVGGSFISTSVTNSQASDEGSGSGAKTGVDFASGKNRQSMSMQGVPMATNDAFLYLPDVHMKAKNSFAWTHVDLVILVSPKFLIARNCNQSVATYYDLKRCNPIITQNGEEECIVGVTVNDGQNYVIKASKAKFESLMHTLTLISTKKK